MDIKVTEINLQDMKRTLLIVCLLMTYLSVSSQEVKQHIEKSFTRDKDAQNYVGWCYSNDQGTEKNESRWFEWYMKAAIHGCAEAQYQVALSYSTGQGIEKNEDKAFEWCLKALHGQNGLAILHINDFYKVAKEHKDGDEEYFKWVAKAAEEGYAPAYNDLAYCYMYGIGVVENKTTAWECLNKAIAWYPTR